MARAIFQARLQPGRRSRRRLAAAVLLAALVRGSAVGADQKVTAEAVVDADYAFRLDRPGEDWRLLGRSEVRSISPDAQAGAILPKGPLYGVVIPESAPGLALEPFARMILDNMPLEEKKVTLFEERTFAGEKAFRADVAGKIQSVAFRYAVVVVLHGGYAYQLIAWTLPSALVDGSDRFQPFFDAFHFLPGKVRGRPESAPAEDASGPGWRVSGGVYSNSTYRFSLRPPVPWSVVVGGDLLQMNSSAEVGLQRSDPDAYLVLIPERAAGVDAAAFAQRIRTSMAENLEKGSGTGFPGTLGKVPVVFSPFRNAALPSFEFHHAVVFRGDVCFQVLAWNASAVEAKIRPSRAEVLSAVEFLEVEAAESLAREIDATLADPCVVGPAFAFRNGFYRDFEAAFTWRRPSKAWRVRVGRVAREQNADASLWLEEPSRGLLGAVVADAASTDARLYHDAAVRRVLEDGGSPPAPEHLKLGDLDALSSLVRKPGPVPMEFHVTTAVRGGRGVQLNLWGIVGNLETSKEEVRAAIEGLRVPAGGLSAAPRRDRTSYVDERAGFSLRAPGPGWTFHDETPAAVRPAGSFVVCSSSNRMIGGLAASGLPGGRDPNALASFILRVVGDRIAGLSKTEPPAGEAPTLSGRPCLHLAWSSPAESLDVFALVLDQTLYAAVVQAPTDGSSPSIEEMKRAFALID